MNYFIRDLCRNRFVIAAVFFMLGSVYQDKCQAQSYQVTTQGYNQGTVQINGNIAQYVNPMGYTTQTATIYSDQVVITTPQGYATSVVGTTMYTVPPSPPSPPSPRVLQ